YGHVSHLETGAIVSGHLKTQQRPAVECAHADSPQTISPSTGSSSSNVAHEPCSPPKFGDIAITLKVAVRWPVPSRGWKVTSTFSPWLALRKSHKDRKSTRLNSSHVK